MRTLPTYKVVVKTNRTRRNGIKTAEGGRSMIVDIVQTGTRPAGRKEMLRLSDLRRAK